MDIPENNPSERRSSNATQMSNSPSPLPRGGQLAHTLFWPAEETFPNVSESHGPNEADKSRELSLNPPVVTLSYIASPSTPNLLTGSSLAVSQQNLVYPFTLNMHDSNLPWFPERDNASEVPGDEPAFFPQFVNFAFSQSSQPSSSQPSSSQPSSSSYLRSSDMRSIGNTTTESTTGPETTPRLASAYSYYGTGAADGSDGGQG
ncbi:hypothetical protein BDZ91DRAFT_128428 [Kalaharituber pfeilii]|nr:hypothetical protein BDZ91DRAFT_128428 [Kalaharituber pfeilii]